LDEQSKVVRNKTCSQVVLTIRRYWLY